MERKVAADGNYLFGAFGSIFLLVCVNRKRCLGLHSGGVGGDAQEGEEGDEPLPVHLKEVAPDPETRWGGSGGPVRRVAPLDHVHQRLEHVPDVPRSVDIR